METLKTCPRILFQKLFLTIIIGAGCLLVGAAYFLFCRDTMLLFLSLAVFIGAIAKSLTLYLLIRKENYETLEGVCIGISGKPLRRYRKIRVMDQNGIETSVLLAKQIRIRIGNQYRFYFKQNSRLTFGNEYLDTSLASDYFLGLEDLGEYSNNANSTNIEKPNPPQKTETAVD